MPVLLFKVRKSYSKDLSYIEPFLWLTAVSGLYEVGVTYTFNVDSTIWFKIYTLLEFLFMYYFFSKLFGDKYKKILSKFLIAFVLVFVFLQSVWLIAGKSQTDSGLTMIQTLFVFTTAFLWFREIFTEMKLISLWDSPAFYFISGFILYFSGTFFLFVMTDLVFTPDEMGDNWIINIVLSLLLNIILLIGVWKGQNKSIQYSG